MRLATNAVRSMLALAMAAGLAASAGGPAVAAGEEDLFAQLIGKWGGSGLMTLSGNRRERLACQVQYTGGGSQLSLAIDCRGGTNKVDMRATVSSNSGRLFGTWEERNYNVIGTVTGNAVKNRVTFRVQGVVVGEMVVATNKSRQKVDIKVTGIPLETVSMNLTRR